MEFSLQSACEEDSFQCGEKGTCIPNYKDGSVRCKWTMAIRENPAVSLDVLLFDYL